MDHSRHGSHAQGTPTNPAETGASTGECPIQIRNEYLTDFVLDAVVECHYAV